jgi:hypothetical protein
MTQSEHHAPQSASAILAAAILLSLPAATASASSWTCAPDTYQSSQETGVDSAPYRITVGSGGSLYVLQNQHFVPADWQAGDELKICIDLTYPARFKAFDVTNVRLDKRVLTSAIGSDGGAKPSSSEQSGAVTP